MSCVCAKIFERKSSAMTMTKKHTLFIYCLEVHEKLECDHQKNETQNSQAWKCVNYLMYNKYVTWKSGMAENCKISTHFAENKNNIRIALNLHECGIARIWKICSRFFCSHGDKNLILKMKLHISFC